MSTKFSFFSQSWCWKISYSDQFICQCSENFLAACCFSCENCNVDFNFKITQMRDFSLFSCCQLESHSCHCNESLILCSLCRIYVISYFYIVPLKKVPFFFLSFRILHSFASWTIFFLTFKVCFKTSLFACMLTWT